jgi:hypothetical protein
MDSKRLVSLESFNATHYPPGEKREIRFSDGNANDADDDDEWVLIEGRKRKRKDNELEENYGKARSDVEEMMGAWISSVKIEKLCEILEAIRINDPSEKVIVFSQVY